jgi:F0F1-type ATP synthase membrane subunit c/vacuolar-type H+-ATPase subunit K
MNGSKSQLDLVRFGVVLGLVAVLYGWGLGIVFGAGEDCVRRSPRA